MAYYARYLKFGGSSKSGDKAELIPVWGLGQLASHLHYFSNYVLE
jgi:hypothetical protein